MGRERGRLGAFCHHDIAVGWAYAGAQYIVVDTFGAGYNILAPLG